MAFLHGSEIVQGAGHRTQGRPAFKLYILVRNYVRNSSEVQTFDEMHHVFSDADVAWCSQWLTTYRLRISTLFVGV